MNDPKRIAFLTTGQAAIGIGISERTLHRYVADGQLAYASKLPGPSGAQLFDVETVAMFALLRRLRVAGVKLDPTQRVPDFPRIGHELADDGQLPGQTTLDDFEATG